MAPTPEPTSPSANSWSAAEDEKLQRALGKFGASVENRWGLIAEEVGSRNKEQCKKRQKALELQLKKQEKSPQGSLREIPEGAGTPERAPEAVEPAQVAQKQLNTLKSVGAASTPLVERLERLERLNKTDLAAVSSAATARTPVPRAASVPALPARAPSPPAAAAAGMGRSSSDEFPSGRVPGRLRPSSTISSTPSSTRASTPSSTPSSTPGRLRKSPSPTHAAAEAARVLELQGQVEAQERKLSEAKQKAMAYVQELLSEKRALQSQRAEAEAAGNPSPNPNP